MQKEMKFVHIADMHFDCPFVNLSSRDMLGDLRRLEQRKIFKEIIEYIKENHVEYFFISGDLYEHKYIRKTTIEYINNLFKQIPETKIYIAPGNHDPYIKNSYYYQFEWSENVTIFTSKIHRIETEDAFIYGYGFDDFYCTDCGLQNLQIKDRSKPNILIIHGTLDGASIEEKQYNSITAKLLEEKGFDYVALGHIHKTNIVNSTIVYPGSTMSLGFDEQGEHGMVVGSIENGKLETKFHVLEGETFIKRQIDISQIYSKEELIEIIMMQTVKDTQYIEIVLTGSRNFEIDVYELIKYIQNDRIIKIKDETKIAYDLETIAKQSTLKGVFVNKMLEKLNQEDLTEEQINTIQKAIEIGIEALE